MYRFLARYLPLRWRQQLPLYGYLDLFVQTFATTPGPQRGDYLTYAFTCGLPYGEALRRFGGVRNAFQLVMGERPPANVAALFAVENLEIEAVRTIDISNNVEMALNFVAAPDYLRLVNQLPPMQEPPNAG